MRALHRPPGSGTASYGLCHTWGMDLWGQLIGRKDQTLVVVEATGWVEMPASAALDRTLERRRQREKWTDAEEGHDFHVLLARRRRGMTSLRPDLIDVDVFGVTAAVLDQSSAEHVLDQMRAADATATAAKARATCREDGTWKVEVLLGA